MFSRVTRSLKKGPAVRVTEAWLALVAARMEELGLTRSQLAERVGCDPSVMTRLFNKIGTRYVMDIAEALEISPPAIEITDPDDAWWVFESRRLRDAAPGDYIGIRSNFRDLVDAVIARARAAKALDRAVSHDAEKTAPPPRKGKK